MKPRRVRGKWQALFSEHGKVYSAGVYPTYAEAQKAANRQQRKRHTPTVADALSGHIDRVRREGIAPSSVERYEYLAGHLAAAIGSMRLADLSRADVEAARDAIGLGSHTVKDALRLLSAALRRVVEDGLIAKNPCVGVKVAAAERPAEVILEPEQARALYAAMGACQQAWVGRFLQVLLLTMRRSWSELAELRWQDVDLDKAEYSLYMRKVKRWASWPLPSAAVDLLREQRRWQREYYGLPVDFDRQIRVFSRPYKTDLNLPLARASVQRAFDGILASRGLPHLKVHALRGVGATLHFANGVDPMTVMALGGWSNAATMQRYYARAMKATMREAGEKLGAQLRGQAV